MKEEDDYLAFLGKLQKRGSHPYKIQHCLGSRDAWKWVRKNKWRALGGKPFDQLLYSKIINMVNKNLVDKVIGGHIVELPHRMGSIYMTKKKTWVKEKDGVLMNNYRTDWEKTLRLWYEDEEARNSHKPVKKIDKYINHFVYSKDDALFKNRTLYLFRFNRSIVKKLAEEEDKYLLNVMNLEQQNYG